MLGLWGLVGLQEQLLQLRLLLPLLAYNSFLSILLVPVVVVGRNKTELMGAVVVLELQRPEAVFPAAVAAA
jgi:hypothetical protein